MDSAARQRFSDSRTRTLVPLRALDESSAVRTQASFLRSQPHEVVEARVRAASTHAAVGAPAPHASRAYTHAAGVRASSGHPGHSHVVQQLLEPAPSHVIVLLLRQEARVQSTIQTHGANVSVKVV
jgi:hypothetical protein